MDILKELETIKENNNHRSLKTARINGANIEIEGNKIPGDRNRNNIL